MTNFFAEDLERYQETLKFYRAGNKAGAEGK